MSASPVLSPFPRSAAPRARSRPSLPGAWACHAAPACSDVRFATLAPSRPVDAARSPRRRVNARRRGRNELAADAGDRRGAGFRKPPVDDLERAIATAIDLCATRLRVVDEPGGLHVHERIFVHEVEELACPITSPMSMRPRWTRLCALVTTPRSTRSTAASTSSE